MTELTGYLQNLVRNDPARVLPAVKDIVVALHSVALESVNVAHAPDLFEVGKSFARLDDAGIEIVTAIAGLLGAAGEESDPELARIQALIATLPAPRVEPERLMAPVRSRASAFAGGQGGA